MLPYVTIIRVYVKQFNIFFWSSGKHTYVLENKGLSALHRMWIVMKVIRELLHEKKRLMTRAYILKY